MKSSSGQSMLEYATLITAVALALGAMSVYAQRAMNANLSNVEDELNAAVVEPAAGTPAPNGEPPGVIVPPGGEVTPQFHPGFGPYPGGDPGAFSD